MPLRPKSFLARMAEAGGRTPRPPDQAKRPSSSAQGYGRTWRRLRMMILHRDPVCVDCKRAPATEVDHIISKRRGGTDAEDNLQGMCTSCHARKGVREDGLFGRKPR